MVLIAVPEGKLQSAAKLVALDEMETDEAERRARSEPLGVQKYGR